MEGVNLYNLATITQTEKPDDPEEPIYYPNVKTAVDLHAEVGNHIGFMETVTEEEPAKMNQDINEEVKQMEET